MGVSAQNPDDVHAEETKPHWSDTVKVFVPVTPVYRESGLRT